MLLKRDIVPKEYATAIHYKKEQTKIIAVKKSNGYSKKLSEDGKKFVDTNPLSIASSPGKKANTHELYGIQSILGRSCITVKRTKHWVSAKRSHLMSVPTYKTIKWAIKPQLFCRKKVDNALIRKIIDWVLHNSNVHDSSIVRNNVLI